jgi:DNA polymerase-3 subunit delta
MKVRAEQFAAHIDSQALSPVYVLSGDEPLLVQEAADHVRRLARESGCAERIILEAERGFDWQALLQSSNSLSLFAQQRLLELRLPGAKPGDAGSKALQAYVQQLQDSPSGGDVLLLMTGKIDKSAQQSKWFRALDSVAVIVQFWPLRGRALLDWIQRRLLEQGLRADRDALRLLADRSEGNLLACAQDIDKLALLHDGETLDAAAVMEAVINSARYDVFVLVDAALAGDRTRVARIMAGLHGEGTEATVVLWALARELRVLQDLVAAGRQGLTAELQRRRVWNSRKPLYETAVTRLSRSAVRAMLLRAARLDRVIKGVEVGNVWDELLQLTLMLAGVRPLKMVS